MALVLTSVREDRRAGNPALTIETLKNRRGFDDVIAGNPALVKAAPLPA